MKFSARKRQHCSILLFIEWNLLLNEDSIRVARNNCEKNLSQLFSILIKFFKMFAKKTLILRTSSKRAITKLPPKSMRGLLSGFLVLK